MSSSGSHNVEFHCLTCFPLFDSYALTPLDSAAAQSSIATSRRMAQGTYAALEIYEWEHRRRKPLILGRSCSRRLWHRDLLWLRPSAVPTCALPQIVYTSAIQGIAGDEPDAMQDNMVPLFKAIMGMPKPLVKESAPLQVWRRVRVLRLMKCS